MAVPAVRPVAPLDLPAIHAIYAHHVQHSLATFEETPPSLAEMTGRCTSTLAGGFPFLVAELDHQLAGYAYASPFRTRSAYRFSVEDSVYVAPEHQRRGVGRSLLSALIAQCAAGPWQQMIAVIGDSQNTPSIRLHQAFGFAHIGTLTAVGFKHIRWVDTVLMQRKLHP